MLAATTISPQILIAWHNKVLFPALMKPKAAVTGSKSVCGEEWNSSISSDSGFLEGILFVVLSHSETSLEFSAGFFAFSWLIRSKKVWRIIWLFMIKPESGILHFHPHSIDQTE